VVAGVRKSWSFSVGSFRGGVISSSCPIRDGDVVGVDGVAVSFLISDGEVSSSDESYMIKVMSCSLIKVI
jgi:hypothetical protein